MKKKFPTETIALNVHANFSLSKMDELKFVLSNLDKINFNTAHCMKPFFPVCAHGTEFVIPWISREMQYHDI